MGAIADINTKVQLAVTAQESGDYTSALAYLRSAQMLMAGLPNTSAEGESLTWNNAAIAAMVAKLEQLQAANLAASGGLGLRRTKIKYQRAGGTNEY